MWRGLFRMRRLLLVLVLGAGITGCAADDKPTAPKTSSERLNSDKPNANDRITAQAMFGEVGKGTWVGDMRCADDASYGFTGVLNSASGVGALSAAGSVGWFQRVNYETRDVLALSSATIVPRGLVVAGAHDTDGDGNSEVGYASLYSSSGSLLSLLLVSSTDSDVWLNGIVPVDDSTLVACGGERRPGVEHPRLTLVHLRAPGQLELGQAATLQDLPGRFLDIVALPSSPGELALATVSANGAARSLHGLRATWPGLDPVTVEWSREIASIGEVTLNDLQQAGGNLYLAGSVRDNRKPPPRAAECGPRAWRRPTPHPASCGGSRSSH